MPKKNTNATRKARLQALEGEYLDKAGEVVKRDALAVAKSDELFTVDRTPSKAVAAKRASAGSEAASKKRAREDAVKRKWDLEHAERRRSKLEVKPLSKEQVSKLGKLAAKIQAGTVDPTPSTELTKKAAKADSSHVPSQLRDIWGLGEA